MEIYEYEPKKKPKGWTRKMGYLGWEGDEMFVPARYMGISDMWAMLICGFEGEKVAVYKKTTLVPEALVRRECPEMSEVLDLVRCRAEQLRGMHNKDTDGEWIDVPSLPQP